MKMTGKPLTAADAGLYRVTQTGAEVVHQKHRQRDRKTRPEHASGVLLKVISGFEQKLSPR